MLDPISNKRNSSTVMGSKYPRPVAVLPFLTGSSNLAQPSKGSGLSQASLEDLMNTQVTSVSKKEQTLSKARAAVFLRFAESSISGEVPARSSPPSEMGQHARIRQQTGGWKYSPYVRLDSRLGCRLGESWN